MARQSCQKVFAGVSDTPDDHPNPTPTDVTLPAPVGARVIKPTREGANFLALQQYVLWCTL